MSTRSMLQSLNEHSSRLLVAGDSATAVLVRVRENELGWRVNRLQQLLMSYKSKFVLSQLSDFHQACSEAERVCGQVETVVRETMPASDADQVTLTAAATRLDQSLVQLIGHKSPVEAAIRLAYNLPLSATELSLIHI